MDSRQDITHVVLGPESSYEFDRLLKPISPLHGQYFHDVIELGIIPEANDQIALFYAVNDVEEVKTSCATRSPAFG